MTDWTSGYVADIGYTYGYYHELNPLRLRLPFLNAGLVPPDIETACELGFGQGISVNIHAAAGSTAWWGTDFNPGQAAFAKELARASGAQAELSEDSFQEFCARADLPMFDFIGLHGIWSWISNDNRSVIVDFLRRKLKVGGIVYVSYNAMPGWAAFGPMRHLLTEHAECIGSDGHGIVNRINGALEFAKKLVETNPAYARANPIVAERLKALDAQNRHYLAHEYFNLDWQPMHFADICRWLESAKLSFACSAHYLDHVDALNLSADQQKFLGEVPDRRLRETARDFMVNQQFRRDYWIKGARRLSGLDRVEKLRGESVVLLVPRDKASLKADGHLRDITMRDEIYNPILDALADNTVKTIGSIEDSVKGRPISFNQLTQAIIVLAGTGQVASVQSSGVASKAKKQTSRLNQYLLTKARSSNDITHLASPLTGGAINVQRFAQLFLLAQSENRKTPADWANSAWRLLSAQDQRIMREGAPLQTAEENIAELTKQADEFAKAGLPILKHLQIA